MTPDANWPNLVPYKQFTAADHAAHTTPKGIPRPEDMGMGQKSHKLAKLAMKFAHKPHLKMTTKTARPRARRRKER